jgi:hypothetical protein
MRLKLVPVAAVAALAISLLGAASASAATEFGDNCIGDESIEAPITLFEISASGNPLPTAAPVAGVITKWKVNLVPVPVVIPVNLKVLRQTGPNTVQVVGDASGSITGGANSFATRIPVLAGDRLGFFSPSEYGPIICDEEPGGSVLGGFEGSGGGVGSSVTFVTIPASEARLPLAAVIEPDADNDGFGDETQDACPQSATTQAACPPVTLSTGKQVRKGSVTILVTSSTAAPVTVKGVAKLGKGKKAKLNGGTQTLAPGALGKFTLFFTKGLKKKLKELPPKRSVNLNVTITGTSVSGAVTTNTLKVKLRGQAKP